MKSNVKHNMKWANTFSSDFRRLMGLGDNGIADHRNEYGRGGFLGYLRTVFHRYLCPQFCPPTTKVSHTHSC